MSRPNNQLAYQEAAVRNAGPVDLVIILYDILARDLQGAIAAMEARDIEKRGAKIKHGFLALQQLEGTLNMEAGGELAKNMARFYSMMRKQMIQAEAAQDPAVLQELIQLLFSVREAWVEVKGKQEPAGTEQPAFPPAKSAYEQPAVQSASWKA